MVWVWDDISDCVGFCRVCIVFLAVVINSFDCLSGDVECVMMCLPSKVGIVTSSECCAGVCYKGGVGSVGKITGVFDRVTHWCLRGAIHI